MESAITLLNQIIKMFLLKMLSRGNVRLNHVFPTFSQTRPMHFQSERNLWFLKNSFYTSEFLT